MQLCGFTVSQRLPRTLTALFSVFLLSSVVFCFFLFLLLLFVFFRLSIVAFFLVPFEGKKGKKMF